MHVLQDNAKFLRGGGGTIVLRDRKCFVSERRVSWECNTLQGNANVLQENANFPRGMQYFLQKNKNYLQVNANILGRAQYFC